MSQFSSNPILVINVGFLLGFGFAAVAAQLVARELGCSWLRASAVGLIFAFLPFHFLQGVSHPFVSGIWAIPPGVILAVWALRGELPIPFGFGRNEREGTPRASRVVAFGLCVVVASTSQPYYTVFAMLLVICAAFLGQGIRRSRVAFVGAMALSGIIGLIFASTLVPSIMWRHTHGANPWVAVRPIADIEQWSLHLAQMLVPGTQSRIIFLHNLGASVRSVTLPGEPGMYVGLLAIAGLCVALGSLVLNGIRSTEPVVALRSQFGLLSMVAFVISTIGGLNVVLGAFGFTQLRAWSRMSPYIALFGLLALSTLPVRFLSAYSPRVRRLGLGILLIAVVLIDQVPASVSGSTRGTQSVLARARKLNSSLAEVLPAKSMIFQLPVISFPEDWNAYGVNNYELSVPYIVGNHDFSWSFGGVRGREADWQLNWGQEPPQRFVAGIALAEFDALSVSLNGYPNHAQTLIAQLGKIAGQPHRVDDALVWFDLRSVRQKIRAACGSTQANNARNMILNTPVAHIENAEPPIVPQRPHVIQWFENKSKIVITNSAKPANSQLILELSAVAPAKFRIQGKELDMTIRVGPMPRKFTFPVDLSRGRNEFRVNTDAPIDLAAPSLRRQISFTAAVRVDTITVANAEVDRCLGTAGY